MAYYGGGQGAGNPGNQPQLVRTSTGGVGHGLQPQLFSQLQFAPASQSSFQHQQHQQQQIDQSTAAQHQQHHQQHLQLLQQQQQQVQQQQQNAAAAAGSPFQNLQVTSFLSDQLAAAAAGVNQIISQAGGAANLVNSAVGVAAATAALNFQQQQQQQQSAVAAAAAAAAQQGQGQKQRVFTGTVTKIHDNFGFIDDECFFNTSVVRGPIKCMQGDRVLVEAEYNPSTPFKWNATRVQIVNMGGNIPHSLNSATKSQQSQQSPSIATSFSQSVVSQSQLDKRPAHAHGQGHLVPPPAPIISIQQQQQQPNDPRTNRPGGPTSNNSNSNNGPGSNYSGSGIGLSVFVSQSNSQGLAGAGINVNAMMRHGHVGHHAQGQGQGQRPQQQQQQQQQQQRQQGQGILPMPVPVPEPLIAQPPPMQPFAAHLHLQNRFGAPDLLGSLGQQGQKDHQTQNHRDRRRSRSRSPPGRGRENRQQRSRSRDRREGRGGERDRSKDRSSNRRGGGGRSPSPSQSPKVTGGSGRVKTERENSTRRESQSQSQSAKDTNRPSNTNSSAGNAPSPVPSTASSTTNNRKRSKSRERERSNRGDRDRRSSPRKSRTRSPSPKRERRINSSSSGNPRYNVVLPNFSLDTVDFTVIDLKKRYPRLYIPSELFMAKAVWIETFPITRPFELTPSSPIHVFRKHSEPIELGQIEIDPEGSSNGVCNPKVKVLEAEPEPEDTRKIFQAKVLLLSLPGKTALYENSGCTGEPNGEDAVSKHLTKLLNFVCGVKLGKTELMAIGGPYSPSLDGPNPQSDPQVLINTAIRNCKTLTGIDLSRCKRWYRFMELYYRRSSGILETVVIYIPDLSTILPSPEEWTRTNQAYEYALYGKDPVREEEEEKIAKVKAETKLVIAETIADDHNQEEPKGDPDSSSTAATSPNMPILVPENSGSEGGMEVVESNSTSAVVPEKVVDEQLDGSGQGPPQLDGQISEGFQGQEAPVGVMEVDGLEKDETVSVAPELNSSVGEGDGLNMSTGSDLAGTPEKQEKTSAPVTPATPVAPAHQLDVNSLTVNKLKEELSRRGLPVKGLKNQLIQRLNEAIEAERIENEKTNKSSDEEVKVESELEPEKPKEVKVAPVNPDVEMTSDHTPAPTVQVDWAKKRHQFFTSLTGITVPVIPDSIDEKSLRQLERRYALPKRPHIIAHPSGAGKTLDVDLAKLPLASLREYKAHDFKEKSFEVSLFAEFFYEMLQRDFAFKIYLEAVKKAGAAAATVVVPEDKDTKIKDEKDKEKVPESSEATNTKSVAPVQIPKKINSPLLLAFTFFDTNRCGFIREPEFEELCLITGIGLNRSQIRKLMQKIFEKNSTSFYYNVWTEIDGDAASDEDIEKLDEEFVKNTAKGNKSLLPVFLPTPVIATGAADEETTEAPLTVLVDGTQINVRALLAQIQGFQKERANSEANLNVVTNLMNDTKVQYTEIKKSNDTFKTENLKLKESLKGLESLSKTQGEELEIFKKASERFFERIKDFIKPAPAPVVPGTTGSGSMIKKEKDDL